MIENVDIKISQGYVLQVSDTKTMATKITILKKMGIHSEEGYMSSSEMVTEFELSQTELISLINALNKHKIIGT